MSSQINTRKPTGRPAWPLYLVEGPEKSGKTYLAAQLTASERFSQAFWVDWNEGAADEYAALPGADYDIVVHDGTFKSVANQIHAVHAYAKQQEEAGEAPVLLIIDSMTAEWDQLKDKANRIAMSSPAAKRKLEKDPGADVPIPMHAWNTVGEEHGRLMRLLMTFPGVVVMTARGKEVAAVDENGRPKEKDGVSVKDYKVEGHKNLAYDASCVIRMSRDVPPQVVGMRSVQHGVRPGVDAPKPLGTQTLESLTFDVILGGGQQPSARDVASEPELSTRQPDPEPQSTPEPEAGQQVQDEPKEASMHDESEFSDEVNEAAQKVRDGIRAAPAGNLTKVREWAVGKCSEGHPVVGEVDAEIQRRQQSAQGQQSGGESFDWEGAIEDAQRDGNAEDLEALLAGAQDERTAGMARAALKKVRESEAHEAAEAIAA